MKATQDTLKLFLEYEKEMKRQFLEKKVKTLTHKELKRQLKIQTSDKESNVARADKLIFLTEVNGALEG